MDILDALHELYANVNAIWPAHAKTPRSKRSINSFKSGILKEKNKNGMVAKTENKEKKNTIV